MKKRFGFTLAEVLITLGIIGVVAAMTIPTLIQNTNSVKFQSQFKKSISTLSQAALMAQAQHDIDYAGLTAASTDGNCSGDSLANPSAAGEYTMCGLFNSTLAGQTYLGTYGNVPGATGAAGDHYEIAKVSAFDPDGYLIYSLADGSFVGFNPNTPATGCGITPGNPITAARLAAAAGSTAAGALHNCMGFIDVNGPTSPNREVTCADGTAALGTDAAACALATVGAQVNDVYPIVFHNGTVEPASNAARAALTRAK